MNKYLFWDFDGTLGGRIDGHRGLAWSMSLLEAIHEMHPKSRLTVNDIVPHLKQGFPWHEPEKSHLHLNTSKLWWDNLEKVFIQAYENLGFSQEMTSELAQLARKRFLDLSRWELYEDTIPVLRKLQLHGWKHIIVSNHVPELDLIVSHLELDMYITDIINSAVVGFEKPNPRIYKAAFERALHAKDIWMIGDNINADVLGAEQAGIKAILVRSMDPRARYSFQDLYSVERFLQAN
ncbi:MAG TPA: HAD-IA family hydrolase [Clostridiales bacterium]|nr:HAD-IA family hydrolase [Clostridiales bacterium]